MHTHRDFRSILQINLILLVVFGLGACSASSNYQSAIATLSVQEIQTIAVQTFYMELTLKAPTETGTPIPSLTPTQTETPEPTYTPTITPIVMLYRVLNSSEAASLLPTNIAFYLIVPEAGKECTYYMRPVLAYPYPQRTGVVTEDISTALKMLFAMNEANLGVFLNPLAPAGHRVISVLQEGSSLVVNFTGNPARTDNPCTNRQMRDQIYTTVSRIARDFGIYDIVMWVDSMLYDDFMIGE